MKWHLNSQLSHSTPCSQDPTTNSETLAESFYNIIYGSSIITSKVPSKILSNQNIIIVVYRKIVSIGIFIQVLTYVFITVIFDQLLT